MEGRCAELIPILRESDSLGIPKSPVKWFKVASGGLFAMGQAIVVRTDYTGGDVRRVAQRVKNAAQRADCLRLRRCSTAARESKRRRSAAWTVRRCGTG